MNKKGGGGRPGVKIPGAVRGLLFLACGAEGRHARGSQCRAGIHCRASRAEALRLRGSG